MRDLIIIGSGPAGFTAAIYAARADLSPLVLAGQPKDTSLPGGQLMFTTEVENFPGFHEGISGPELMEQMRKQAERFGAEILEVDVEETDFPAGGPFRVRSGDEWHAARAVVVATGANAKWLNLPNEKKYRNRGISACAVCDGLFFRGQEVMVVRSFHRVICSSIRINYPNHTTARGGCPGPGWMLLGNRNWAIPSHL